MRQKVRKGMQALSLLLFPLTFFFLSPYVIIMSATQGVVSGSALVFGGLLVFSIITSRLYCGWLCPGGILQDVVASAKTNRWNGRLKNLSKYGIWVVWFSFVIYLWITNKPLTVDPMFRFHLDTRYMIIYLSIAVIIYLIALFTGKRGMCHSVCWMAPFMVIGEKLADLLHIPRFRLQADPDKCTSCGKCTRACPMSLDIAVMVKSGHTDSTECIGCLVCADGCPKKAIDCGILPKAR